jgi:hypothetical protein
VREWNDHALATEYRQHWAEQTNRALKWAGHDARIDHRSLEDQGIDRTPTQHQGPVVGEMVKRGVEVGRQRIQPVPPSMDHGKALADRQREEQERVWRGEKQEQVRRAQADRDTKWAGLAKANAAVAVRRSACEAAEHEHEQKQERHGKTIKSRERRAERVEHWIGKHPWRYRLHDSGWWPSKELNGLAAKWLRQDKRAERQIEGVEQARQAARLERQAFERAEQEARKWEQARQAAEKQRDATAERLRAIDDGRWTLTQEQEQVRRVEAIRKALDAPQPGELPRPRQEQARQPEQQRPRRERSFGPSM